MLWHGRATFRGMHVLWTNHRATTSLLYAGMIVAVQVCMCVDELATESEGEFGSVQMLLNRDQNRPRQVKRSMW